MLLRVCGLLEYSCQLSVPINYLSFLNVNKGAGSAWQLTIKLICWINFLKCKKRHRHRGNNHTELLPKINRALNTLIKSTPAHTGAVSAVMAWVLFQRVWELRAQAQVRLLTPTPFNIHSAFGDKFRADFCP